MLLILESVTYKIDSVINFVEKQEIKSIYIHESVLLIH